MAEARLQTAGPGSFLIRWSENTNTFCASYSPGNSTGQLMHNLLYEHLGGIILVHPTQFDPSQHDKFANMIEFVLSFIAKGILLYPVAAPEASAAGTGTQP